MRIKSDVPEGFDAASELPASEAEQRRWQEANRTWWERNPMRYDWKGGIQPVEFSKGFYEEIDRRFFEDARKYMPWKVRPFEALIDFDALGSQDVLEIGTGSGSHAQLIAPHARSYTGIDLTEYAVTSTSRRLETFGIPGRVLRMDAEEMDFPDASFDLIWTWGVIHHSSNTARILEQMRRVLRPGGRATVMVYHKSFWMYYVVNGFFNGVLRGDLLRTRSIHRTNQVHTDGAIARYYRPAEWEALVNPYFKVTSTRIFGSKAEMFPLPGGRVKTAIMAIVPNAVTRFFTNTLHCGVFLVTELSRRP